MVTVEEAVIARIETGGQKFEILIEPDAAEKYKESKEIDWEESLVTDEIWSDSKKGDRPSEEALNEAFGTLEKNEIFSRLWRDFFPLEKTTVKMYIFFQK